MFKTLMLATVISGTASAQTLNIVTDIAPMTGIASAIGAEHVHIEQLIENGASAHHFNLKPSNIKAIETADIIILSGPSLLPGLVERIESIAPNSDIIIGENIQNTVHFELSQTHEHDDDHDHDHDAHQTAIDPHMWLLAENAKRWAQHIADQFNNRAPQHRASFDSNLDAFSAAVDTLTLNAPKIDHDTVIGFSHDAFQYALHDFGHAEKIIFLNAFAQAPSVKETVELETILETSPPLCIIVDPNEPSKVAEQFARGFDISTFDVSPIFGDGTNHSNAYLDLYATVIAGFRKCLDGKTENSH